MNPASWSACSEKELAAGHYKGGFGFNPLLATCGREVLAAILRPGNAGANNADDHLEVFELALEQRREDGAWVAELTGHVSLDAWPQGSRLIVRRERPHPGAQLSFSDVDGHRFQCFITDQPGNDLVVLEARHRADAIVEDRVRGLKSTGLADLPFSAFAANQAWLEAALCAHDLTVWTQLLLLDGEHAVCEPKRLHYQLLHVAGRLTRHARRLTLHLPSDWPWAAAIAKAFKRLATLPPGRAPTSTSTHNTGPRQHVALAAHPCPPAWIPGTADHSLPSMVGRRTARRLPPEDPRPC